MTIASIVLPRWISWDSASVRRLDSSNSITHLFARDFGFQSHINHLGGTLLTLIQRTGQKIHYSYGLHRRCSSLTDACDDFPQYEDCHGSNRAFCSLWRSMAFLMSFAVIVECATLIAYAVVILGGKQKRDQGWKIVCTLLTVSGLVQCAVMAIVVCSFRCCKREIMRL